MIAHTHRFRDSRIFVFGSNLAGIHGAGGALYARLQLGALQGIGEGLMPGGPTSSCYALPTKDASIRTLPIERIRGHVETFLAVARATPQRRFFVSRIGCGLAGYTDHHIAPLFRDAPLNCDLPPNWRNL